MHARSVTFDGEPGSIDAGIAYIQGEVMPMITSLEGCVGLSTVVDRETGKVIVTSAWQDARSMHASNERLATQRSRGGEILGAAPRSEEWEVAVMHRDHTSDAGSCCRITWARPRDLEGLLAMWRTRLLPQIEALDGFCSASMLVDRAGGRTCGTVTFDSRASLEASREGAAAIRAQAAAGGDVEFLDLGEFELVIAHLRLPELV